MNINSPFSLCRGNSLNKGGKLDILCALFNRILLSFRVHSGRTWTRLTDTQMARCGEALIMLISRILLVTCTRDWTTNVGREAKLSGQCTSSPPTYPHNRQFCSLKISCLHKCSFSTYFLEKGSIYCFCRPFHFEIYFMFTMSTTFVTNLLQFLVLVRDNCCALRGHCFEILRFLYWTKQQLQ